MSTIEDQPPPQPNERTPVWELVIADMQDRDRLGRERYGTPLQVRNGRDGLIDLYQELLDAAVYVRKEIEERRDLQIAILRRVNELAEADMLAGNPITGAHHRAIERVLKELESHPPTKTQ